VREQVGEQRRLADVHPDRRHLEPLGEQGGHQRAADPAALPPVLDEHPDLVDVRPAGDRAGARETDDLPVPLGDPRLLVPVQAGVQVRGRISWTTPWNRRYRVSGEQRTSMAANASVSAGVSGRITSAPRSHAGTG